MIKYCLECLLLITLIGLFWKVYAQIDKAPPDNPPRITEARL